MSAADSAAAQPQPTQPGSRVLGWVALIIAIGTVVLSLVTSAAGLVMQISSSGGGYGASLVAAVVIQSVPLVPALVAIMCGAIAMAGRTRGRILGAIGCGAGVLVAVSLIASLIGVGVAQLM